MESALLVDAATRLAMIAERIARLQAQIGRDVLAARSRRALGEASAQFERGLAHVSAAALTPEARDNYRLLRHLWDEYRTVAAQPPSPDLGRKLAERNEEVVWIAAKGARMLQAHAPSAGVELVAAAGGARSAAQRIAKVHLQRGWALQAGAGARELDAADAEVHLAFARLKSAPAGNDDVALALRMAEAQYALMRQAVERLEAGRERAVQLEHIAKTADHVAELLDRVARFHAGGG